MFSLLVFLNAEVKAFVVTSNPNTDRSSADVLESKASRHWLKPLLPLSKGAIAALIFAAVALSGASFYVLSRFGASKATALPSKTETVAGSVVSALGYLQPEGDIVNLSAPMLANGSSGRIYELLVEEGDQLKAGDPVAVLDSFKSLSASAFQAKERVEIAQAQLAQVQAGAQSGAIAAQTAEVVATKYDLQGQVEMQQRVLDRLTAELDNAEAEYERYQQLFSQGAIAAANLDQKRLAMVAAQEKYGEAQANRSRIEMTLQSQVESAQASLNEISEVRPTDLRLAQAQLQSAASDLLKAEVDLEMSYVRAPTAGQVLEVYARPGEVVGSQGIVTLGQTQQMNAIAQVYELDINKVRLGQSARITSDALTEEITGKVVQIGAQVNPQNIMSTDPVADVDQRIVAVKIRIDPSDRQKVSSFTNLQVTALIDTDKPL